MTKVTIPNDVADTIEFLRTTPRPLNNEIIAHVTLDSRQGEVAPPKVASLRSIPFDTLMSALINGYEREQTVEERTHEEIRCVFASHHSDARLSGHIWHSREHRAYADGIKFAVDTLGIKVTGVNA